MSTASDFDYVLIGGGLQNCLNLLAIRKRLPKARVLLLESQSEICGNHTWSFHHSDIPADCDWAADLPSKSWPRYDVCFPGFRRPLELRYDSMDSASLRHFVNTLVESDYGQTLKILTETAASSFRADRVSLASGETFTADCVISATGPNRDSIPEGCGFQKFVGWEIRSKNAWPSQYPTIMDADVPQTDGFRFFYTLPFEPHRVLVEETRFSDSPELQPGEMEADMREYIEARVGANYEILRWESGCLPMPFEPWQHNDDEGALKAGYEGGWFHAATGYSFPLAVRFAQALTDGPAASAPERLTKLKWKMRYQFRFSRFLNRLLFRLVRAEKRYTIFRRFYQALSSRTIQRFYNHSFGNYDAFRICVGRPPSGLTPVRFFNSFRRSA